MVQKLIKKIIVPLAIVCLLCAAKPSYAWGEKGFTITGDKCGLKIELPPKTVDTGNLNPGDKKYSSLKLTNTGDSPLTVYIRTNIKKEKSPRGGHLADVMPLTIRDGSRVLADDLFRVVAKKGSILIGKMAPGEIKTIEFDTALPRIGNEYQGATMKVNWTFITECSGNGNGNGNGGGNGGDNGGGSNDNNGRSEIPLPVDDENEDRPIVPEPDGKKEPEAITTPDEMIPFDPEDMPGTGEIPSLYFYGAGVAIAMLGIVNGKKR